jgi:hypothetical protein
MLFSIYYRGDQVKDGAMIEACSTHDRDGKFLQVLVGKPERKRPLWRSRRRWEDNIKDGFFGDKARLFELVYFGQVRD